MASTALASPALAKDDSWYIGAEFGAMLVEDTEFEINGGPDAHSIDHEYGFDGGGYVGYIRLFPLHFIPRTASATPRPVARSAVTVITRSRTYVDERTRGS